MIDDETKEKPGRQNRISQWSKKICKAIRSFLKQVYPGKKAWRGAGIGAFALSYLAVIIMAINLVLPTGWIYFIIVLILFPAGFSLVVGLALFLIKLLQKLPEYYLSAILISILMSAAAFMLFKPSGLLLGVFIATCGSLLGASVWTLVRGGWHTLIRIRKVITISGLILGLCGTIFISWWMLDPGKDSTIPDGPAADVASIPSLADSITDPSMLGDYPIETLTYGSGSDLRRSEFAEEAAITTKTVDGSQFVGGWSGLRKRIWGFDSNTLPLNGRVWYPDAEGQFPLVLIVHGNHLAEAYSDLGYSYLCELLASRGTICVSVDENFLNSSFVGDLMGFKGLEEENDLRGWLLLEHLALWEDFSEDSENQFYKKVDLSKIALIGHSRGGEAVAVAAAFNQMAQYPDNGLIKFNYGFDIQSIIAIAPIDGQYKPAGEMTTLTDINYLVLQGSHDMDVTSFDGYNTFERVRFTDEDDHFKSAVYIWGANHGQFNTTWGDNDVGLPAIWLYNREQLISVEDQMQISKVLVSAFIEVTLKEEMDYLPLFQNIQSGGGWLPDTAYLNAYADSEMAYLLTYEEDIDLSSGSVPFVQINAQGLKGWHEDRVSTKWGQMTSNSAVYLMWNQIGDGTFYDIQFTVPIDGLSVEDDLVFSAAQTHYDPDGEGDPTPADFSVELRDQDGNRASLRLSSVAALLPAQDANLMKVDFLSNDATSETVFQTYLFDLSEFIKVNSALDITNLSGIRIIFNQTESGEILIDDLGFRNVD